MHVCVCAGSYFNEAMDALLARMPNLTALHLGNNQLDARQAEGLATSFVRHRLNSIENLTLGSNDIGDAGLAAILKALPNCMKQLYLHGIDCSDTGVLALRDAIEKWDGLWGLGKPCHASLVVFLCLHPPHEHAGHDCRPQWQPHH